MAIRKVCVAAGCDELAIEGLAHCPDHEARRLDALAQRRAKAQTSSEARAGRALYKLTAWGRASKAYLRRNPLCADCLDLGVVEAATEVDHIVPHRGDRKVFFDRSNWQGLCKSCHSRKTAREVFHGGGVVKKSDA